jgi:hypothetical protein
MKKKKMTKKLTFLKNLIMPVTPMTVITIAALMAIIWAFVVLVREPSAALYAAVITPITLGCLALYVIDRILIIRFPYYKMVMGEIIVIIFVSVLYSIQNRTTAINFHTDQDFILVIFDSEENPMADFKRSGFFGKEWDVYNNNIIHLDSSLLLRKELRINEPDEWGGFIHNEGRFDFKGRSVKYIFSTRGSSDSYSNISPGSLIDSLLNQINKVSQ